MSASGSLFLQTFVFPMESRIFRVCQEIRNYLIHGRRCISSASGPSRLLPAMVAGVWPSTRTLAGGSRNDSSQVRSCIAGQSCPPRRAVRKTLTQAKTCQLIHRTPAHREIAVAAAHAEGKTAVTTTQTARDPMAANPAVENAKLAAPVARAAGCNSVARCQLPSNSTGGRNC